MELEKDSEKDLVDQSMMELWEKLEKEFEEKEETVKREYE